MVRVYALTTRTQPDEEGLGLNRVSTLGRVSGFRARVLGFGRGFRSWVP